ncbi:MAG TPA: serine/threonine-protein kinase [Polyangia bacterium]
MIGDKYRIERLIATGGQGVVVEATHLRLRQAVAIKFAHVDLNEASEAERHERLFREARAAFRLRSEHVARVIDVDIVEGSPFIVMEFLRGTDLKALIEARGPLPCDEAVGMILQACEGLAEAHDLGLVHRDLKPSNLFLVHRPSGPPLLKILDFGLAKQLTSVAAGADDPDLTEPLIMLGSPRYMSPEQARDPRQTDVRTDIWSLGLVLQELLTGRPVFRARNKADVLALVLLKNPTPVSLLRSDVPAGLERILLRCLQKLPEHRFPTIRDLAQQLAEFAPPWAAETLERLRAKSSPDQSPSSPASRSGGSFASASQGERPREDDLTPILSVKSGAAAKWQAATQGLGEPVPPRRKLPQRAAMAIGLAALAGTALGYFWDPATPGLGRLAGRSLVRQADGSRPVRALAALPGAEPLPSLGGYALEPLPAVALEVAHAASPAALPAEPAAVGMAVEGTGNPAAALVSSPSATRLVAAHPMGKRTPRGGRGRPALAASSHSGVRAKGGATTKLARVPLTMASKSTRHASPPGSARVIVETEGRADVGAEADASAGAENPLDGRK